MRKPFLFLTLTALVIGVLGLWFWQRNSYSKEILRLEIIAPSQATMGEEITYTVRWKNNGNVFLEKVRVVFAYPKGSLPVEGESLRINKQLNEIYPGQEETLQLKGRLFGKEGD